jgi:serine/threonine protein kinase
VTSQIVGTPAYMAPEQLTAGELGLALDVFAWASTITFAATGRPPFGNDAIPAIINRILNQEPDLDGIETPLLELLVECLSKDPAQRPSAQQILDRLVRGRGHAPEVSSQDPRAQAVLRPAAPGERDALRLPARAGEVGPSDRTTAPGDAAPNAPKKRRGTRAAAISVTAAVVVAGLVGVGVAMLPGEDPSALSLGKPQTSQASAATTGLPAEAADHGSVSPIGTATIKTASPPVPATSPPPAPNASSRPRTKSAVAKPIRRPRSSATSEPTEVEPTTGDPSPSRQPSSKPSAARLVELGPGHFTDYCVTLGWEWVEYRETPKPGAYCVKRKGDQTMYLAQSQRDAGCRWRFNQPRALHRFKGKSNYCYIYR